MEPMFEILPRRLELVVEIGTYLGGWLSLLLSQVKGDYRVVCVDPWGIDAAMGDVSRVYPKFTRRFARELASGKVTTMRMTSIEASRRVHGPIDLLHIDGNHREVAEDLTAWVPLVRQGGLVVGHDCRGSKHSRFVQAGLNAYFKPDASYDVMPCWGKRHISCFYFVKDAPFGAHVTGARLSTGDMA